MTACTMEFLRSLGLQPKLGLSYGYWRFSGISRTYVASKTISGKLIPLWKLLDCLYSLIYSLLSSDFWALQGTNTRISNAGCLRDGRDSASEIRFCGRATETSETQKGHVFMDPVVIESTVPEVGPVHFYAHIS